MIIKQIDFFLEQIQHQKRYSEQTLLTYRRVLYAFHEFSKTERPLKVSDLGEASIWRNYLKYLFGRKLHVCCAL